VNTKKRLGKIGLTALLLVVTFYYQCSLANTCIQVEQRNETLSLKYLGDPFGEALKDSVCESEAETIRDFLNDEEYGKVNKILFDGFYSELSGKSFDIIFSALPQDITAVNIVFNEDDTFNFDGVIASSLKKVLKNNTFLTMLILQRVSGDKELKKKGGSLYNGDGDAFIKEIALNNFALTEFKLFKIKSGILKLFLKQNNLIQELTEALKIDREQTPSFIKNILAGAKVHTLLLPKNYELIDEIKRLHGEIEK
jgi:hypothetical protein